MTILIKNIPKFGRISSLVIQKYIKIVFSTLFIISLSKKKQKSWKYSQHWATGISVPSMYSNVFIKKYMLLIKSFRNNVFLNTYAKVSEMHTIPFPVYFLKVRYSSEVVWASEWVWAPKFFERTKRVTRKISLGLSTTSCPKNVYHCILKIALQQGKEEKLKSKQLKKLR